MKVILPILFGLLSLHFAVSQSIQLDIKVFLEGPFLTGQMTTDLNYSDFLPLTQPYGSPPWNYGGTETVAIIPNDDIVDWILIDLVSVTFTDDTAKLHVLDRKACFLIKTGLVKDLDGMSLPTFQHDGQTSFHVRVHHRNHLNIISSSALTEDLGLFSWDFTTGSEKALGGVHAQKEFINGQWGMISSDGNASGQVDNVDKNEVWFPELGMSGYLFGDFNMNGQVDMDDKLSQWMLNTGRGSHPVRDSIAVPTFTCGDAISDIDGNVYNTVLIGDQCWMKENLRTTTYRNGSPIAYPGTDNFAWESNTIGAYAWYYNDITWKNIYGGLYNWFAVDNPNGLCPEGWHVPDDDEWAMLLNLIGGIASPNGNKLKSCRAVNSPLGGDCNTTEHPRWNQSGNFGTDDFGFSGLPGGYRSLTGDWFPPLGSWGGWWTSSEFDMDIAWPIVLFSSFGYVLIDDDGSKWDGQSVRCLKDMIVNSPPSQPSNPSPEDETSNVDINTSLHWSCSDPDEDELYYSIYFGTNPNPDLVLINYPDTFYLPGMLDYGSTYFWKIVAYDIHGDSTEGSLRSFTAEPDPWTCGDQISDIDGNTYNTVLIGTQCWMKENLKATTYNNGTPIPNVTDNLIWANLTSGAYAWYVNDINWKDK